MPDLRRTNGPRMKYMAKKFSAPGSGGSAAYCAEHGHTLPDSKGKCLRCSAKVRHAITPSDDGSDLVFAANGWRFDPQFPGWLVREAGPHSLEHKPSGNDLINTDSLFALRMEKR